MSSNRVGGPNPAEPNKGQETRAQQHRRVEKVEKVKEVDEVENEQTRKKFQSYMEDEPEQGPRAPSPFETNFYFVGSEEKAPAAAGDLEDADEAAIPSPSYSPPPDLKASASTSEDTDGDESSLPRSQNFWKGVDAPPDLPPKGPSYKETAQSSSREHAHLTESQDKRNPSGKSALKNHSGKEKFSVPRELPSPIEGRPSKTTLQKEKSSLEEGKISAARHLRREEEEGDKTSPFAMPEQGKGAGASSPNQKGQRELSFGKDKEKEPSPFAVSPSRKKKEESDQKFPIPEGKEARLKQAFQSKEKEERRGKEQDSKDILESIGTPLIPPSIAPLAENAAVQATPYLNPETLPLFFQMVGTIYVMTLNGISRTEILLNNPAFSNSKFYGSTITIEKYATAPDSLNIRLTGSNEAVTAFNQNIPSLMSAFQNGNFSFRIGRIDAVYSNDRPVFRRKESGEDKRESGGGDLKDRRK